MRKGGVLSYVGTDHLGSPIQVTDTSFVALSQGQQRYTPFGTSRDSGAGIPTDHLFTSHVRDASLGLYWYSSRAYDPALGRFCQPDTVVQTLLDPQSLNRYGYVRNTPLGRIDRSGRADYNFDYQPDRDRWRNDHPGWILGSDGQGGYSMYLPTGNGGGIETNAAGQIVRDTGPTAQAIGEGGSMPALAQPRVRVQPGTDAWLLIAAAAALTTLEAAKALSNYGRWSTNDPTVTTYYWGVSRADIYDPYPNGEFNNYVIAKAYASEFPRKPFVTLVPENTGPLWRSAQSAQDWASRGTLGLVFVLIVDQRAVVDRGYPAGTRVTSPAQASLIYRAPQNAVEAPSNPARAGAAVAIG